jgi:hypothetical protein
MALATLYTGCLQHGIHPWPCAKVAVLMKPARPDYTKAKAYHSISLMECSGKVLERVVANRLYADIENFDLLPQTQFAARHHSAVDGACMLHHKVAETVWGGQVGLAILFDISGFFDSLQPDVMCVMLTT